MSIPEHTVQVIQEILNTQAALVGLVKKLIEHERDGTRFESPDPLIRILEDHTTRMRAILD